MPDSGITGITLTTGDRSVTVTPEAFDRYARGVRAMPTATMMHIRVPTAEQFEDEFMRADDLAATYEQIIHQHSSLDHLHPLEVVVLWRKSGGKKGGRPIFGKTSKRSGLVAAFTSADFIVWLAADHVLAAEYSDRQITALLHHELMHISYEDPPDDQEGARKYVLVGHDFELFADELRIYGAWEEMLQEAAEAFKQAPLFGDD